jgi:hypothetical protein
MAAKPPDIRIIKKDTCKPNYSANYPDPIPPLLIKSQIFFPPSFLYPAPANAGEGASEFFVAGMAVCNFRRI